MGREEKADGGQAAAPAEDGKKPYIKPALRRLGSVRELTQLHPSKGAI